MTKQSEIQESVHIKTSVNYRCMYETIYKLVTRKTRVKNSYALGNIVLNIVCVS